MILFHVSPQLENVFVKQYAPNHMFSPEEKRHHQHFYEICPKVMECVQKLIRSSTPYDITCMANIMIQAQSVLQIFCSQGPL